MQQNVCRRKCQHRQIRSPPPKAQGRLRKCPRKAGSVLALAIFYRHLPRLHLPAMILRSDWLAYTKVPTLHHSALTPSRSYSCTALLPPSAVAFAFAFAGKGIDRVTKDIHHASRLPSGVCEMDCAIIYRTDTTPVLILLRRTSLDTRARVLDEGFVTEI